MPYTKKHVFFHAGDIVELKQEVPNKPKMIVQSVTKSRRTETESKTQMLGVRCFWFTTEGLYQEKLFSSKDLIKE